MRQEFENADCRRDRVGWRSGPVLDPRLDIRGCGLLLGYAGKGKRIAAGLHHFGCDSRVYLSMFYRVMKIEAKNASHA